MAAVLGGVVVAVGTIEVPAMLYSWLFLHRMKILRIREELMFLALLGLGALVGLGVRTVALRLVHHL